MKEQFLKSLKEFALEGSEKNITVALSGGADSMCLLYLLLCVKDELGLNIKAAHLNHCLRGEESDSDELFVRKQCEKLGVELIVKREDVALFAKESKISTELAARKVRYDFFESVCDGVIATAHNSGDNLETVILNLVRGTAIDGLCGIPKRRDIFIRPLLDFGGEEIRDFCEKESIPFVVDSTNNTDDYTRNFIRHNIVPLLKNINPSVYGAITRMTSSLREDNEFIKNIAIKEFENRFIENKLSLDGFENLDKAIANRIIKFYIEKQQNSVNALYIEEGYKVAVNKKGSFSLDDRRVFFAHNGYIMEKGKKEPTYHFKTELVRKKFELTKQDEKIHNLLLKNAIDCDKIVGALRVRTRKSGDKITFAHRKVGKSLRKLFIEDKIATDIRDLIPVIADDNGVVWVYGYGVDKRVYPSQNTKEIFSVECKKIKNEKIGEIK